VGVVIAIVVVFPDDEEENASPPPVAGSGGEGNAPQASGEPKPTQFYDSGPSSTYAKMAERSVDPRPATLDEVFGKAQRLPSFGPFRGIQVTLKDSRLDTDCAGAAWGGAVQQALRAGGCSQLIRGLYVDDNNRYIGQVFFVN